MELPAEKFRVSPNKWTGQLASTTFPCFSFESFKRMIKLHLNVSTGIRRLGWGGSSPAPQ